jgi:hypothetical protein
MGTTISSFPVLLKKVYDSNPMLCVGLKPNRKNCQHSPSTRKKTQCQQHDYKKKKELEQFAIFSLTT